MGRQEMHQTKIKAGSDQIIFNTIAYAFLTILAVVALIPFFLLIVNSFATEKSILTQGYQILPGEWTLEAYKMVFAFPQRIINAYGISLSVTILGTLASLFFSSMAAFVLYRKDCQYRNVLAFFLFFTTLFNGGLMPSYMIVQNYLHLGNTFWVLLLIPLFSVFNILILRNFFAGSVPDSLAESAKIDGAGDFTIYAKIFMPLSKPALASIGLFTALTYWNDWWTGMMYIKEQNLMSLQYVLYQILQSVEFASKAVNAPVVINTPSESLKLAMTVIATGPIIFLYPFIQKYFVAGITIGAVKG